MSPIASASASSGTGPGDAAAWASPHRRRIRPRPRDPSRSGSRGPGLVVSVVLFLLALSRLQGAAGEQPSPRSRHPSTGCISSGTELLRAVTAYYDPEGQAVDSYGTPIEDWCLSPSVLDALYREGSDLETRFSATWEGIVDSHGETFAGGLTEGSLALAWLGASTNENHVCADLCAPAGEDVRVPVPVPFDPEEDGIRDEDEAVKNDPHEDAASDNDRDQEEPPSLSASATTRSTTTTSMLVRLIPVKLVAVLSLMCLALGLRQMYFSVDSDSRCWCCCKWFSSVFGSRYASYEGIDPSDVSEHQKNVEFELLELAAELDAEVVIS